MTHQEWFGKQHFSGGTNLYYNLTRKGWEAALENVEGLPNVN